MLARYRVLLELSIVIMTHSKIFSCTVFYYRHRYNRNINCPHSLRISEKDSIKNTKMNSLTWLLILWSGCGAWAEGCERTQGGGCCESRLNQLEAASVSILRHYELTHAVRCRRSSGESAAVASSRGSARCTCETRSCHRIPCSGRI